MLKLKSKLKHSFWGLLLSMILVLSGFPICAFATEINLESDRVIVSLGDSYSSGEGIEPFYGLVRKWYLFN